MANHLSPLQRIRDRELAMAQRKPLPAEASNAHLEALKSDRTGMDFRLNDRPKCPHCGHDCDIGKNDWWGIFTTDGDVHEKDCPSCGRPFKIKSVVTFKFTTDEEVQDE